MKWITCESIQYTPGHQLTLYRSDDNQYIAFVIQVGLDQVSTVSRGPYLHIYVGGQELYYYALSVSNTPGVQPFKIYSAKENPYAIT